MLVYMALYTEKDLLKNSVTPDDRKISESFYCCLKIIALRSN